MKLWLGILSALIFAGSVRACIWDADTLSHEESRSHDLASSILGPPPAPDEPQPLLTRIKTLEAKPDTNNPDWWNNLAGAYLRLGRPAEAVKLLEPVVSNFPDNYGIHANLGTAYHLLGRYPDAEKEIARDLEINPAAHFGLEKYHLALLQYLMQGTNYQSRHLYVDEFTLPLFYSHSHHLIPADESYSEINPSTNLPALEKQYALAVADTNTYENEYDVVLSELVSEMITFDAKPAYRAEWNLAEDTNFEAGVIYMAQMNPKEPACYEMLGMAAWKKRDFNLAAAAFEKAVALGSPKALLLKVKIARFRDYVSRSLSQKHVMMAVASAPFLIIGILLAYVIHRVFRRMRRRA